MYIINSISEFHRLLSLPEPLHPLISVIQVSDMHFTDSTFAGKFPVKFSVNFYIISIKRNVQTKMKYGQQYYDFDKGVMNFSAPKQIQSLEVDEVNRINHEHGQGYVLIFHPDFLHRHPLATAIKNCGFFSYAVNEALHLSATEEANIIDLLAKLNKNTSISTIIRRTLFFLKLICFSITATAFMRDNLSHGKP